MQQNALEPRPETLDLLARSRNSAAVPALAAGLVSPSREVRAKCVQLLLARSEPAAHRAIVSEWTRFDTAIRNELKSAKSTLESACKEILHSGSHSQKQAVITAISDLDMTAALSGLIPMALETNNPLGETAMAAVFEMCDRWGQRARSGKDLPSVRLPMLDAMLRAVVDFPRHRNFDLIDAWLMLVSWDDSPQRSIVSDPLHVAFRPILDRLSQSDHKSVLQLLAGYVWRSSTPKSILSILCERPESELAVMITDSIDENMLGSVLRRLRELPPLASLQGLAARSGSLGPTTERRLWLMLAANSPAVEQVLAGGLAFYRTGTVEGRRTAADIVRNCRRLDVETLVQQMHLADSNPTDQSCAGAHLNMLLQWIGGESALLDAAAREFFSDFTLVLLMDVARKWPAPLCRVLARVVSRVEPEAVPQLLKALESPSPKRRLLALQVIQMLEVTNEISQRLLPLVDDSRIEVRLRAIDLLGALGSQELADLLPALLEDPTTDIQDAARRALRRWSRKRRAVMAAPPHVDAASPLLMTPQARTR